MDYWYFKPSRPREAKGGIKAQSKRGGFGQSWWAKRWIAVLEGFDIGARLSRGRSYARNGQVVALDIGKGSVKAEVQGSRPNPYTVEIAVRTLSAQQWQTMADALSQQAVYAARLLAGEMPDTIEEVFQTAKVPLFPSDSRDLETACSCPDWSNPCKHVAAVYYLLGEEFDRDPFLLFKLRGMERDELLAMLGSAGGKEETAPPPPPEPLPADPQAFWGRAPETMAISVTQPPLAAALPRRLGKFPLWRGTEDWLIALEPVYRQASAAGITMLASGANTERKP